MNIKELVGKINKNRIEWLNLEELSEEFNIPYNPKDGDEVGLKITIHPIVVRKCTDTEVGIYAYMLDGKFAGISMQSSRKGDISYTWMQDMYKPFKEYLISCMEEYPDCIEFIDEKEDISEWLTSWRKFKYTDEVMWNDKVEYNGEIYTIDKTWRDPDSKYCQTKLYLVGVGVVESKDCLLTMNLK